MRVRLLISQAWQAARKSAEAALPARPDGYTCAESYALVGTEEHLVALVGEQYATLPPTDILRFVDTKPKPSLAYHDPNRGYVFGGAAMNRALLTLLERVRVTVRAVDRSKFEEEEEEDAEETGQEIDQTMITRLKKRSSIASAIVVEPSGQKPSIKSALIAHLHAKMNTLDAKSGVLNHFGSKVATYDRKSAPELEDRDPNKHLVHRSTGVKCAWLEEPLSPELQLQYDAFESQKLNRWIVHVGARSYFLCATGDALFGGDTTSIKSSMLLIGKSNQAKSALLNAAAAAGGWKAGGEKCVDTKGFYAYSGAESNALVGKDKTLRNAMYTLVNGLRLVKFNELESTDVWGGVKGLSNMEAQSVTTKKQSSGATSVDLVETPYAMLSCNEPPEPPPFGCADKVAVITPAMLGSFVSDHSEDGVKTFKNLKTKEELNAICPDDAVRAIALPLALYPSPLRIPRRDVMAHVASVAPAALRAGPDAARHVARAQGALRRAPGRALRPREAHAHGHEGGALRPGHMGERQRRGRQRRLGRAPRAPLATRRSKPARPTRSALARRRARARPRLAHAPAPRLSACLAPPACGVSAGPHDRGEDGRRRGAQAALR